jgi:hypothetical protein
MVQPQVHTFSNGGVNGVFENKPETNNFDPDLVRRRTAVPLSCRSG